MYEVECDWRYKLCLREQNRSASESRSALKGSAPLKVTGVLVRVALGEPGTDQEGDCRRTGRGEGCDARWSRRLRRE
jgi:hypothetical protein